MKIEAGISQPAWTEIFDPERRHLIKIKVGLHSCELKVEKGEEQDRMCS